MRSATSLLVLPLVALAAPSRRQEARHENGANEDVGLSVGVHGHGHTEGAHAGAQPAPGYGVGNGRYATEGMGQMNGDRHDSDYAPVGGYQHPNAPNYSDAPDTPALHPLHDPLNIPEEHEHGHSLSSPHSHSHSHSHLPPPHPPLNPWPKAPPSARPPHAHSHSHNSHTLPRIALNDTDVHYWHSFPPSYVAADFRMDEGTAIFGEEFDTAWRGKGRMGGGVQEGEKGEGRQEGEEGEERESGEEEEEGRAGGHQAGIETGQKGWMAVHVVAMCVAYFGALPIALALRGANHAGHHLVNVVFLGIALLGWVAGAVYKGKTPDRYIGESHSGLGNTLILLSISLSLLDALGLLKRTAEWCRRTPKSGRTWLRFRGEVLQADEARGLHAGYAPIALAPSAAGASGVEPVEAERHRGRYGDTGIREYPNGDDADVVFAIGDDLSEDGRDSHGKEEGHQVRAGPHHVHSEHEHAHDVRQQRLYAQNGRSRFSTGSTSSTGSSGSEHTLHEEHAPPTSGSPRVGYPFALPPTSGRGRGSMHKHPLEMGAYVDVDAGTLLPHPADEHRWDEPVPAREQGQVRVDDVSRGVGEVRQREMAQGSMRQRMTVQRFGEVCLTWIRRGQVVLAYVAVLSGITIYTGMCRASFLPSCLAHYIKGSIFFGYGVLTFARYLGAYADMGWAWNRAPAPFSDASTRPLDGYADDGTGTGTRHTCTKVGRRGPSAEMVESAVIFTYGITNTWMERFSAQAGDPYTVKQVQHISIAIMFWFAGLAGMLLESETIRRVLGSSVGGRGAKQPASYAFSFNPLPALVIAVTGLAMAAHHQTYLFQVHIHSLWGILLAGGSLFRLLTYMFLYLRPPVDSTLPSRPPTEILTAFGWATGGIVFILSSEEVTYAAMRAGYDDVMAFLNVTVALTALVFCWEVAVLSVKGWGVMRVNRKEVDVDI